MQHLNLLELRFYDNIKAHLSQIDVSKLKNVEYVNKNEVRMPITKTSFQTIRSFYEYYIDGKSLYKEIHLHLWNRKLSHCNYAYEEIGIIGAFNAMSDWIEVQSLLLKPLKREDLLKQFPSKSEIIDDVLEYHSQYEDDKLHVLYGCPCGDKECGGLEVMIKREDGFYKWIFGENELEYTFSERQYKSALKTALNKNH